MNQTIKQYCICVPSCPAVDRDLRQFEEPKRVIQKHSSYFPLACTGFLVLFLAANFFFFFYPTLKRFTHENPIHKRYK